MTLLTLFQYYPCIKQFVNAVTIPGLLDVCIPSIQEPEYHNILHKYRECALLVNQLKQRNKPPNSNCLTVSLSVSTTEYTQATDLFI